MTTPDPPRPFLRGRDVALALGAALAAEVYSVDVGMLREDLAGASGAVLGGLLVGFGVPLLLALGLAQIPKARAASGPALVLAAFALHGLAGVGFVRRGFVTETEVQRRIAAKVASRRAEAEKILMALRTEISTPELRDASLRKLRELAAEPPRADDVVAMSCIAGGEDRFLREAQSFRADLDAVARRPGTSNDDARARLALLPRLEPKLDAVLAAARAVRPDILACLRRDDVDPVFRTRIDEGLAVTTRLAESAFEAQRREIRATRALDEARVREPAADATELALLAAQLDEAVQASKAAYGALTK